MYVTIRMHQERHFSGLVIGTDRKNPDFVALPEARGAHDERVERTEYFEIKLILGICVGADEQRPL